MIAARSSIRSLMALGRPLRFFLAPGQEHDLTQAHALLEGQTVRRVIADRGYYSNGFCSLVANLAQRP
jgi:transposase